MSLIQYVISFSRQYWLIHTSGLLLCLLCVIGVNSTVNASNNNTSNHPTGASSHFPVIVQKIESHSPLIFTQGFIKQDHVFYISSGLYKQSFIQRNDKQHTLSYSLPPRYFAEGLTLFNDRLYLLTWKEETLFILNQHTLQPEKTLRYQGEGWGLTHNSTHLIMSNGSSTLLFRDPNDFSIWRRLTVNQALQLNELEYVNGIIWANDWNEDTIYGISEHSGCVIATLDLSYLRQQTVTPNRSNISNGIAYDKQAHGLWVTGKYWPSRYLIQYPEIDTQKIHNTAC
ncbi:glutaminyl-peptide cyclotransferase [Eionea flava]